MAKQKKTKEKKPVKKAAVKKVASTLRQTQGSATKGPGSKNPVNKKAAPKKTTKKGKKKPDTLMCFLTTACVNYYGLSDKGYELNTLRNYRDSYLCSSSSGKKLVQNYYAVSPEIVKRVDKDEDKKQVYAYIYEQVQSACSAIEKRNPISAKKIYVQMVNTLLTRYNLN